MMGIMLKDLLSLRRYIKTIALITALLAAMTYAMDESGFRSAMIAILFAMLPVTSFAYDQQAKWNLFALTLPVSRRDLVASKYWLAIALIVTGTLIGMVLTLIIDFKGNPANLKDLLLSSGFLLAACLCFVSVMIPLIYKFGVENSRILLLLVMGVIVLLNILLEPQGMRWLAEASPEALLCGALAAAAAVMAVSYLISRAIFESRDL